MDLWQHQGQSARLAGAHGLPFVASYHITPATALEAIDAYRDTFVPSAALQQPYVVVSADVVVAEDSATARQLAAGYGHWVYSIRTGVGAVPYPRPDDCRSAAPMKQLPVVKDRLETQFVGDPDEVAERLSALQRLTGADELVVTSVTHRPPRPAALARVARQTLGNRRMSIREGKHRKPIHLAAHFPGVNNTTVWTDPESGSQIEFDSFVAPGPHRRARAVRLLLPGRGSAAARASRPDLRPRRGGPAGHLHRAGGAGRGHRPARA